LPIGLARSRKNLEVEESSVGGFSTRRQSFRLPLFSPSDLTSTGYKSERRAREKFFDFVESVCVCVCVLLITLSIIIGQINTAPGPEACPSWPDCSPKEQKGREKLKTFPFKLINMQILFRLHFFCNVGFYCSPLSLMDLFFSPRLLHSSFFFLLRLTEFFIASSRSTFPAPDSIS
jgi:hypothetical protein